MMSGSYNREGRQRLLRRVRNHSGGKTEHILRMKEYTVGAITQDASVFDTIKLIMDMGVGALLILEAGNLIWL
jgi:predicted transcriptional regulator